jgi:hypothetical protein
MDFFTVPTLTFRVLYCFFIISHPLLLNIVYGISRLPQSLHFHLGSRWLTNSY